MKNAIVLDDEPVIRSTFAALLTLEGYRVKTYDNPEKFWKEVSNSSNHYDVAIIDMHLGEGKNCDGREIYRNLEVARPEIRLVLTSGSGPEVLDAREFRILPKPFTDKELRGAIGDLEKTAS